MTLRGWSEIFPDGVPACCTAIDGLIDVEALLPNIAKGQESAFRRWATSRNAEIVEKRGSCRPMGRFPQLDALKLENLKT